MGRDGKRIAAVLGQARASETAGPQKGSQPLVSRLALVAGTGAPATVSVTRLRGRLGESGSTGGAHEHRAQAGHASQVVRGASSRGPATEGVGRGLVLPDRYQRTTRVDPGRV